jgi:hypothetical protein
LRIPIKSVLTSGKDRSCFSNGADASCRFVTNVPRMVQARESCLVTLDSDFLTEAYNCWVVVSVSYGITRCNLVMFWVGYCAGVDWSAQLHHCPQCELPAGNWDVLGRLGCSVA